GSRAWRGIVNHRWRAGLAALALASVTWFALGALTNAGGAPAGHTAVAQAQGESHAESPAESHAAEGDAHEAAAPQGEGSKPAGFTNVIALLAGAFPHAPWARFLEHYEVLVFSLIVALVLLVVAFLASRDPQLVPSGLQNGV